MAVAEKVIFAEDTATVHVLVGEAQTLPDGTVYEPHESKVLLPGETIGLSEVPSYLQELVKKGEAPCLILLTPNQAKRLNDKAKAVKTTSLADVLEDDDETE